MGNDRIIISCAGDTELAQEVRNYILSNLPDSAKNGIGEFLILTEDEIEIENHKGKITKEDVRDILFSFLESNPKRFIEHTISELEGIFTLGIKTDLLKDMKICEYCGYMSKDYDDMYNHRLFCFSLTRLGS